jgi:hypothetical protein
MALVETSDVGAGADDPERPAIVLHSEIRGKPVRACWDDGRLTGDEELVRRVTDLAARRRLDPADLEPSQVINLAREACAAPIHTELLLPSDQPVIDPGGDPTGRASRPPRRT